MDFPYLNLILGQESCFQPASMEPGMMELAFLLFALEGGGRTVSDLWPL